MLELAARVVLAGVLLAAVAAKLRRPAESRRAMASFGFETSAAQAVAWAVAVLAEAGLAIAVVAGSDRAAIGAALLMALYGLVTVGALLAGRAGAPCGCFGPSSRIGPAAAARSFALAAGFAALPFLPEVEATTDAWLGLGLAAALVACAGVGVAVLALAREVGMLRLRLGPEAALEVPHEGPELGGRVRLIERFDPEPPAELALAVFSSAGCRVCRALEPAVESLRGEPALAVEVFEEGAESEVWESLAIPGAPYAIALERDGTVGAKGTFNNLAQLESILAAAERRRAERGRVEALGV